MRFEKDSRICLCTEFNINKLGEYNKNIRLKWKEIHKESKIKKDLKEVLHIRYSSLISPFEYLLEIYSLSLDKLKEDYERDKKELDKLYKELEEKDKKDIESKIVYIEQSYKKTQEFLKTSKSILRIEFRLQDQIEDSKIIEIIEKLPEKPIFEVIEENVDEDFKVTVCSFINLNKKLDLMHGYNFNRKLDFPKDINEQLGDAFIKTINLNFVNSPLGIKEMEFGENDDYKILNMKIKFSDSRLSNLPEKIKPFIDIIKLFVMED